MLTFSRGWSQDGLLGGCRIRVSSKLVHLPGTSGGPWTPKGTGGTASKPGCEILVPRPEVGPKLLWWGLQVQTAGLTENLGPQGILIGVRPPRGPHLGTKTRLYPTACKLQCWTTQAKQPVRQEYSTTHQKEKKKKKETTKNYATDEGAR